MAIHGTITRIEIVHGFGFIRDDHDGDWMFVLAGEAGRRAAPTPDDRQIARSADHVVFAVGQRVTFEQEWTPQGPRAIELRPESEGQ